MSNVPFSAGKKYHWWSFSEMSEEEVDEMDDLFKELNKWLKE
jgi:hypothetical protein